jgi:electron transfer flavoprotein alpha subunit
MSNVLALVELTAAGAPAGTTPSLLAAATKLGSPVAVVVVLPGGAGSLAADLGGRLIRGGNTRADDCG